jgi:hypothetical protein
MEEMNLSEYKEHVVYNLVNATAERNEIVYACCSESYPDVTYIVTLHLLHSKLQIYWISGISPWAELKSALSSAILWWLTIGRLYAIRWSKEDTAIFADYSIWFEIK